MAKLLGHELITITELNALGKQMDTNMQVIQTRLDKFRKLCLIVGIVQMIVNITVLSFLLIKG